MRRHGRYTLHSLPFTVPQMGAQGYRQGRLRQDMAAALATASPFTVAHARAKGYRPGRVWGDMAATLSAVPPLHWPRRGRRGIDQDECDKTWPLHSPQSSLHIAPNGCAWVFTRAIVYKAKAATFATASPSHWSRRGRRVTHMPCVQGRVFKGRGRMGCIARYCGCGSDRLSGEQLSSQQSSRSC